MNSQERWSQNRNTMKIILISSEVESSLLKIPPLYFLKNKARFLLGVLGLNWAQFRPKTSLAILP